MFGTGQRLPPSASFTSSGGKRAAGVAPAVTAFTRQQQQRLHRFHKDVALATSLSVEEFLASHIRQRPFLHTHKFAPSTRRAYTSLQYDDNVHNRFHPQAAPLKATTPLPPPVSRRKQGCAQHQLFHGTTTAYKSKVMPLPPPPLPRPGDDKGTLTTRLCQTRRRLGLDRPSPSIPPSTTIPPTKKKKQKTAASISHRSSIIGPNPFHQAYDRGTLPASIQHRREPASSSSSSSSSRSSTRRLRLYWHTPPSELDYRTILPLFLEGLRETTDPYRFLAVQGLIDLMEACPHKLLACVPLLLPPLKRALDTQHLVILATTLRIFQDFILTDPERIGPALVPFYHHLLGASAVFNKHKDAQSNRRGGMEWGQQRRLCVSDLVNETLELMEITGGREAFVHIKYMIPTYDSVMK